MENLKQQYLEEMKSMINQIQIEDYRNERIDIHHRRECEIKIDEIKVNFNGTSIEINKNKELWQQEQAANLSTCTTEPSRRFNFIYDYDDDYEESFIPLNEIDYQIPLSIAITPVLPTMEFEDSLIMGDEDLSTIPEKESNKFIKSSVEDLVLIPIESEDTSDSECDLPLCGFRGHQEKYSYVSNLDEPDLFITPLSVSNEDECFDPGDNIEPLLHRDSSTPKMSVTSIIEGFTNEPPIEENDDLFDLESKEN
nr:hypothetical protein [Tanacetum cinerariifolium]